MFEKIINILIIESDEASLLSLRSAIQNPGHNVFIAENESTAHQLLESKKFALIFSSLDLPNLDIGSFLEALNPMGENSKNAEKNGTIIVTSTDIQRAYSAVTDHNFNSPIDYLIRPFKPKLVKTKLEIYKKLYFRHQRISQLLESILPAQTITEFSTFGKSSPKKKENCAVMFTDFVNFTKKTKGNDPQEIVKKLDYYFSKFDEIILKHKLEKIKTIGDAYLAVGGVTEKDPNPLIRTALAALEIRNFMLTDIMTQKALGRDFWEIRIGIHCGDLVAGVVGTHKFSFDVWGDSVNIAARCEQNSVPNRISITADYYNAVGPFFDCTARGEITVKNGGEIGMYFLDSIKAEFTLNNDGKIPNVELRKAVDLPLADLQGLRTFIIHKLKAELNDNLYYHSLQHTLNVEKAVIKYAEMENLKPSELFLVQTAALFHDSGFLYRYHENEELAVRLLRKYAPEFGYLQSDIEKIEKIIMCTVHGKQPENLLEAIMCDADLDYLGRMDYHITAANLFKEMEVYDKPLTERQKLEMQINYLENVHKYYTVSARNMRGPGKKKRIVELKIALEKLLAKTS